MRVCGLFSNRRGSLLIKISEPLPEWIFLLFFRLKHRLQKHHLPLHLLIHMREKPDSKAKKEFLLISPTELGSLRKERMKLNRYPMKILQRNIKYLLKKMFILLSEQLAQWRMESRVNPKAQQRTLEGT